MHHLRVFLEYRILYKFLKTLITMKISKCVFFASVIRLPILLLYLWRCGRGRLHWHRQCSEQSSKPLLALCTEHVRICNARDSVFKRGWQSILQGLRRIRCRAAAFHDLGCAILLFRAMCSKHCCHWRADERTKRQHEWRRSGG